MAPHWPEEVDVFSEPHSRMKKLVHKYSKMVSATDFTDEYHMTSLLQNLIYVFCEFKAHEEIENILIMRNLKRKLKAACVTSAAVCNCHNDNRLTDMLEMVFDGSRSCWTEKSVKERQSYGHELQKALEDFTQNFLPHMEEEEEVFQPMLMQYFSYEELKELKAKVIHEHLVSSKQEKYVEDLCQKKAKTKQEPCYFDRLPDEICKEVFSYLNPQDLCRSAQTCHRWNTLTKDPSLWTGIYPVHWARGNWTFQPDPLGGVDGAGELNEELMEEFDPPVMCHDEDADVDESSSHDYDDGGDDEKDYYSDEDVNHRALAEYKMLSSLVKHLLPCVGPGVKVVDLAYSKGLNNSLVHKILKLCQNVEVLDMTHTQVGDDAFYEYGVSNRRSKLRHLDLTNCHNITDQTLCSLTGASVDGVIQNGMDIEEGRNRISLGGQKESDIEIIPTCCRKKQRVKKCEKFSSNSALNAVENLNDVEAGTNVRSCGVSQIDSSVINVYNKMCDEGDDISRTGNCDKRKDLVNNDSRVHDKNAKLISHPHTLSFETDEMEVHCDAIYRPMQSLPLVSDNNSFCKCENLCQKSENLLDDLTCCQTNSRPSVPSFQKNKNSVERSCCKFNSCDDDDNYSNDDDDYDSQFDCTNSIKSCCPRGSPETSSCAFKSAPNRTDCCHSSTSCDSSSPPLYTSSSSSSSPHSSESSSDNERDGSTSVDADQESFLYSHKTAVKNCVRHHSESLSLSDSMDSEVDRCSFTPGNISSACCKLFRTGSTTPCVKDVEIPSRAMNGLRITRPLSHLQFLSLNGCYRISDAGLRVLSIWGGTPHLEHLDLSGCVQVTGSSVEELVWTCGPQFDHANLFYCDNLPMDPFPTTASGCRNRGCSTRFCCSAD